MSAATRVLALRHGETAWNVQARIQGQLDIPLNDTGQWQAARAAEALAEDGITAIYSSDLARALQTAQALSAATGVRVVTDRGLRERGFGSFEGHSFVDVEARWPEDARRWRQRDPDFQPGGHGESLRTFFDRCATTAARLAGLHEGEHIALVAHGGVMDCLYRAACGLDLQASRSWQLGNAAVNRLLYTQGRFTLVGWNDTTHLEGQPARDELREDAGGAAR